MNGSDNLYDFWSKFDGQEVVIEGLKCKIEVRSWYATYPYAHLACTVGAQPDKRESRYRTQAKKFGDSWCFDLLGSPDLADAVLTQLAAKGFTFPHTESKGM